MINELNISVFDYIFSINEDIKEELKEDNSTYRDELNNKIQQIANLGDFWDEYKYCFNDKCVIVSRTFTGIAIAYNNFPRFTLEMKKEYLDYKLNEIHESIINNGDFIPDVVQEVLKNIENCGKKAILDYCKNAGIIEYSGRVFISADDNPAYAIIYQNIKATLCDEKTYPFNQTIYQNIVTGNNYGTITQNNSIDNNSEDLFAVVLEKLEVLALESKLEREFVQEIRRYCEEKNEGKVKQLLKEIALGTGTNLIATAILSMFGLM